MPTSIIKRDGRLVPFDQKKIERAILKAMEADGTIAFQYRHDICASLASEVTDNLKSDIIDIEQVQDEVERAFMRNSLLKLAKKFILYRDKRTEQREMRSNIMTTIKDLTFMDASENDNKRENANIDGNATMGTMLLYGSEIAKDFNMKFILRPEQVQKHRVGEIHIHDLVFYSLCANCVQIDLGKLLSRGFNTGHGNLRPPKSVGAAAFLSCIALQANQNEMFGGQSYPNYDYDMAPYVALSMMKNFLLYLECASKDWSKEQGKAYRTRIETYLQKHTHLQTTEGRAFLRALCAEQHLSDIDTQRTIDLAWSKTDDDTYQAMESVVANFCTMHSRAGSQVPFSSLNLGTDTSEEGRAITRNLFLATEAGLGNGETPIFPISIMKMKKGITDKGSPNYDLFQLACRCSAKRLFPNFNNLDSSFNLPYYREGKPGTECAVMGCRTRVIGNVHDSTRQVCPGRGNLAVTTINLPWLALACVEEEPIATLDTFIKKLDETMDLVFQQLKDRLAIVGARKAKSFPFLMGQHLYMDSDTLDKESPILEAIKHATLTVGFIGLAETLVALYGVHHGASATAQEAGLTIIKHMRERCDAEALETNLNFSLIASPAEGCTGRLRNLTKKRYGDVKGITDHDYFTNSFHVPVYFPISASKKIDIESPYHKYCNAGAISYVECDGDPSINLEAFEQLVNAMAEADMGYFSINHPVDRDPLCGYIGIIGDTCPRCGRKSGESVSLSKLKALPQYNPDPIYNYGHDSMADALETLPHCHC